MEHADFALYTVKVALHTEKGDQKKDYRIGLRTLTISRDKDEWGEEFCFQVLKKEDIWNTEKEMSLEELEKQLTCTSLRDSFSERTGK